MIKEKIVSGLPFAEYEEAAFPYRYSGEMIVSSIAGGVPTDEHVATGWLKSKLAAKDELIAEAVAVTMAERGVSADEAVKIVESNKHLNGFKRDSLGLYIEGRQLKAALKEAVSVAVAADKLKATGWGQTKKWLTTYLPEHVFVVEDRLYLMTRAPEALIEEAGEIHHVQEPTDIVQRFVHTRFGASIQYEEYVENAVIKFTVITDHAFSNKEWAMIWLTGQQQGIGASRSQGFGRYQIKQWQPQHKD